jgi:death-on-curing protein
MTDYIFLSPDDVIAVHEASIAQFSPGESHFLRDRGLLESAVFAPQHTFDGDFLHPGIVEMTAALMEGLIRNHPFENGNKRVAFAAASVFLRVNGYQMTLTSGIAADIVLRLVSRDAGRDDIIGALQKAIVGVK